MAGQPEAGHLLNLFIFVFILLGIGLARLFPSYLLFASFFIFMAFFAYFFAAKKKYLFSDAAISLLFVCLGALLFLSASTGLKDSFFQKRVNLSIRVVSLPKQMNTRNSFLADIISIGGRRQNYRAKVMDFSKKMKYLNKYRLKAKLSRRTHGKKEFYYIWVKKNAPIKKIPLSLWEKAVRHFNNYCLGVFKQNCSLKTRNFLAAIFLGRKELIGEEKVFIQNAGLSHLLAISGLHVGLISLILFYVLRFFGLNFRARIFILSVFLVFYLAATGFRPSTQRAVIMYFAFALSFFIKRNTEVLNSLGFAGIILLLFSPLIVYDVGFQLSFLAVFGIIIGFKIFPYRRHNTLFLNYIKQIFLCSLFVTVFTLPVISYYFGKIYLLAVFYNVILIPVFTLILFLNLLLIIFSPAVFLAKSLGAVLSWVVYVFQNLARTFGSFSYSYFSYSFPPKAVFIYYCSLFFLIFLWIKRKHFFINNQ